jgi:alkanesulfonate monooxygenase SsuD/methylene tetrahydromethanopterin reductase-like flavin-dependent oxidoreductase (luciferase family)
MKFGLDVATAGSYADPCQLADLAAEAEQAGWNGFFIWDCLFEPGGYSEPMVDPWVTLAAIAMRTRHIKIGAFVTPLPRRRPWKVAREAVTLDHLSGGRLIFAAGSGFQSHDFAPFGEELDPKIRAEMPDEGLKILNGLWTSEPFSFHGKHYEVSEVTLRPKAIQSPHIPIWLAGGWPRRKPFRRAANWDGIYVMTVNQVTNELLTPTEVKEIAAYITAHRESTEPFDIAVNVDMPPDPKQAAEIVRPYFEAGATWCIALSPDTPEECREQIRNGPPKV